jgi:hypothetical protein
MAQIGERFLRAVEMPVARERIKLSNSEIVDRFKRFGYLVSYGHLAFTTETVNDFVEARKAAWYEPGEITTLEDQGILIVEHAQPNLGQPTRDIIVVSLGSARAIMGVLNPPDTSIGVPRYTETM